MSDTANVLDLKALAMVSGAEYKRLARMRERQRRERKEELYSPCAKKHKVCN